MPSPRASASTSSRRSFATVFDFRTTNTDTSLGRVVSDAVRAGLAGSSAFTLTSPATIVSTLQQMKLAATTRVDSSVARQIALRRSIKAIVDGECDQYPEQAFYMVGAIEEVAAKAQKMAAETAKAA